MVSIARAREKYGVVLTGSLGGLRSRRWILPRPRALRKKMTRQPSERHAVGYRVGIDIGGTFTDFALLKGSEVVLHKNLSTPADRSIGVMNGLQRARRDAKACRSSDFLGQCDAIVHGTTIADNTLDRDERRAHRSDHHRGVSRRNGVSARIQGRASGTCGLPPPPADHSAAPAPHRAGAHSVRRLACTSRSTRMRCASAAAD